LNVLLSIKEVFNLKALKNQKGQALVEFAVVLPVILLLVLGIVQFGMLLNTYLSLTNAAREGARAGVVGGTNYEITETIIKTSPSLNPGKMTIIPTPSEGYRNSGGTLTVGIDYNYELTVPIISSLFNNNIVLRAQTSMRIE
jgi:Flp pilus assembly protein TadG